MSSDDQSSRPRVEEYWDWFAVALFLLVTVDLLTTAGAISQYGLEAEINPMIVWLVGQGITVLVVAHIVVVVLAVAAFAGLVRMLRRTDPPYDRYLAVSIEVWLGLLLATGLLVFANNLSVIILSDSLV